MSRLVVLGADGFIGKNLVTELAKNSEDEIVAFDRFSSVEDMEDTYFSQFENVTVYAGNFMNISDIETVLQENDFVFHLVSSTTPASALSDPFIDVDTNVRASVQLFEICVNKNINKLIFLSSGGTVYGDIDSEKISENSVTKPKSPYGIGKLTIENYLRYFKTTYDLDYIIYRIANPFGPHQNIYARQGVIPIFIQHILEEEPITVFGDGTMLRDYIYIDDVVKMICSSYKVTNKFDEYNIGSGIGRTVNEIIDSLALLTGSAPKIILKDQPASYVDKSVLDISRFNNEFGIFETTILDKGLEKTLDYVKRSKK